MMCDPIVTVEAIFDDSIAADIACALLSEGSLRPEESKQVGLRRWLVEIRGLTPTLAHRAEVVLQHARASETRIVGEDAGPEHLYLTSGARDRSPEPQRALSQA